ncbi:D-isomer specific 2-hydroxyacid dehydrogenase, NAD binding domain, partial [Rhizoctonia solani]
MLWNECDSPVTYAVTRHRFSDVGARKPNFFIATSTHPYSVDLQKGPQPKFSRPRRAKENAKHMIGPLAEITPMKSKSRAQFYEELFTTYANIIGIYRHNASADFIGIFAIRPGAIDDATAATALYLFISACRQFSIAECNMTAGKHTNRVLNNDHASLNEKTFEGKVTDEEALIRVLEDGHLYAAVLDVHPNDPQVNPKLSTFHDVNIIPHMGTETGIARGPSAWTLEGFPRGQTREKDTV